MRTVKATVDLRPLLGRLRWWCRYRSVLWWLVGAAALLTATLVWRSEMTKLRAARAGFEDMEWVAVSAHDLAAGVTVTRLDVRMEQRPRAYVPPGALHQASDAIGRIATQGLVAAEALVDSRLAPRDAVAVGGLLGGGERAFAVPSDERTPPVSIGMPVELFGVSAQIDTADAPAVLLSGGRVVSTRDRSVVVAVPSANAPAVAGALAARRVVLAVSAAPLPPR
jgi:hypothetical protein